MLGGGHEINHYATVIVVCQLVKFELVNCVMRHALPNQI